MSISTSNYIPTTTAAPTHTTADQQPAQKRAEEFAKQTLYIPPWARDVAGSCIGEGKAGVGAGIGGCAGIEGCDCIGGGQTISVQHECVSERIIEQNQNIPCGSESEMSYGVAPSDQVYNDNGSVGLWSDVGKNGKILKLMSGWNPQVVCRCVIKDRSGKSKRTVDSKLARRRFEFIHSDRSPSNSVRVSSSVPVVGPSTAPRQEQVVPSSQELGVNCAATGPWSRWELPSVGETPVIVNVDTMIQLPSPSSTIVADIDTAVSLETRLARSCTNGDALEYDSEAEVSETNFGLDDETDPPGLVDSESEREHAEVMGSTKKRVSVAQRRRQRRVRFRENDHEQQEAQIALSIAESEAVAGYARFHGKSESVAFIATTSAGISGWCLYERRVQQGYIPRPSVVSSSVSGRVEPGVHALTRASSGDGVLLPEAEGGQHLGGSRIGEKARGCCSFNCSPEMDLDTLNYAVKPGDNAISSAAESEGGWVQMEVTVDSGACDTVMPISSCAFKILPSYQSKNAMEYEVANGESIANLGERRCIIRTPGSREERRITFQVADVHKPLLSVTRAADAGFDCLLTDTGGFLIPRQSWESRKHWIPISRRGNLYTMSCWVKSDDRPPSPGFGRQR